MATAGTAGAATKWVGLALAVLLALVVVLVWAGTRFAAGVGPAPLTAAADSGAAGRAYLSANKGKPGVHTTASGLQYEVLTEGTGPRPAASDTVAVHYEGKLLDGTVFDSSIARGQPAVFPLNRVIPGWTEGVQLMPTGSKYRFTIPSELAYGTSGAGDVIPPNAVLVFDIELLAIKGS